MTATQRLRTRGLFTNMAKGKTEVVVLNAEVGVMKGKLGASVGCVFKYTYTDTNPTHSTDNFRARVGMAWAVAKQ